MAGLPRPHSPFEGGSGRTRDLFPGEAISSARIGDPTCRIAAPEASDHEGASSREREASADLFPFQTRLPRGESRRALSCAPVSPYLHPSVPKIVDLRRPHRPVVYRHLQNARKPAIGTISLVFLALRGPPTYLDQEVEITPSRSIGIMEKRSRTCGTTMTGSGGFLGRSGA